MSSSETFTRLDVEERRDLLGRLEAVESGAQVRLSYDSTRSSNDQSIEARVVDHDAVALYGFTSDLKGDVFVQVWNIEAKHHEGIVIKTTGGRSTNRQPRLGELLDVEVISDE
ncbi:hypothetical protein [Halobellus rarus]|uniref:Uncharacterized protein n=1 Tax=Halobellus rarus TaxID=1126237 RepID=A0ABD6CMT1_9EURY|nr:hypothetical protein [Halobellus rarus]